jgi:hypothetical protein
METRTSQQQNREHSHYFKDVSKLSKIDVYRVLQLFNVTDPCIQHAVKKLLVAGGRGAGKDVSKDIKEARESLVRWQEMQVETTPEIQQTFDEQPKESKVALAPEDVVVTYDNHTVYLVHRPTNLTIVYNDLYVTKRSAWAQLTEKVKKHNQQKETK